MTVPQKIATSLDSSLGHLTGRYAMAVSWRDGLYLLDRFHETRLVQGDLEDWYRDEVRAEFEYVQSNR